ncbi:hypothetical protein HNY73_005448 [Argiope bruennichi]|uniref:Peptidase A2 domain-containing protein n=1 Tax=Argiope bruennichi TaxID=94029 RepID=A0A8T0FHH4_ARGBR|nr:hypothetical protein HNY73_005448 [Argiope bruennichi]
MMLDSIIEDRLLAEVEKNYPRKPANFRDRNKKFEKRPLQLNRSSYVKKNKPWRPVNCCYCQTLRHFGVDYPRLPKNMKSKKPLAPIVQVCSELSREKMRTRKVALRNKTSDALIDTGSSVTFLREDISKQIIKPSELSRETIILSGLGKSQVKTKGSFRQDIELDEEKYSLIWHVVPTSYLDLQAIIGSEILEQASLDFAKEGVKFRRREVSSLFKMLSKLKKSELIEVAEELEIDIPSGAKDNYPLAAAAGKDFYVDDILSGTEDLSFAIELQDQLIHLLKSSGMELHKWSSNNPVLLQKVPTSDREYNFDNRNSATLKTLGLQFNPGKDTFSFSVQKIKLWISRIDWDDEVHLNLNREWEKFSSELNQLKNLKVERRVLWSEALKVDLIGFGDASKNAYGCAVYTRIQQLDIWWNGPSFLSSSSWPDFNDDPGVSDGEYLLEGEGTVKNSELNKDSMINLPICNNPSFLECLLKISNNYIKIVRVLSYVFRFVKNLKGAVKTTGPLNAEELNYA